MEESDYNFAELVVEKGYASYEQVEACASELKSMGEKDRSSSLPELMVQRGHITRRQADALLAEIEGAETTKTSVAGYELVSTVGRGAMGVVYKARQETIDRIVAIKLLRPELSREQGFVQRFLSEAHSVARFNHPNIVQAIDAGFADGYHYLVMEFIDGPPVSRRIRNSQAIPEEEALLIAGDVASALEHAEKHNLVHRDIKPANIILTSDGTAKLADLGIAKEFDPDSPTRKKGKAIGTPQFMSPEQARGHMNVDIRSDIYSLGATLFRMVTGSMPFKGKTPQEVASRHITQPTPSAKAVKRDISRATDRLIRKMMSKHPGDRFQTAVELKHAIEAVISGEATTKKRPKPPPEPTPKPKWPVFTGVGIVLLAILVTGIWLAMPETNEAHLREQKAREAFDAAVTWRAQHPDDIDAAIKRFKKVCQQFEGTSGADDALGYLKQLQSDRQKNATDKLLNRQLARLRAKCGTLLPQGRFFDAMREVEAFDRKFDSGEADTQAKKIRKSIRQAAEKEFKRQCDRFKVALVKEDYAEARRLMNDVKKGSLPELCRKANEKLGQVDALIERSKLTDEWQKIKDEARELCRSNKHTEAVMHLRTAGDLKLEGIDKKIRKAVQTVEEDRAAMFAAIRAYVEASDGLWGMLRSHEYVRADNQLATCANTEDYRAAAECIRADADAVNRLRGVWDAVESKLKAMTGEKIGIASPRGTIESVENRIVTINASEQTIERSVYRLDVERALEFAELPDTPDGRLTLGLFLLIEAEDEEGFRRGAEALKAVEEPRFAKLHHLIPLRLKKGPDETVARLILDELRPYMERELSRPEALVALRLIRQIEKNYKDTAIRNRAFDRIAGLFDKIEEKWPPYAYLSDREPLTAKVGKFSLCRNCAPQKVSYLGCVKGGKAFDNFIFAHAPSSVSYDLPADAKMFTASVGISDEAGDGGSCIFIVRADGRELSKSPEITSGMQIIPLSVDVDGAEKLELIVEDAGDGKAGDHAVWMEPKIWTRLVTLDRPMRDETQEGEPQEGETDEPDKVVEPEPEPEPEPQPPAETDPEPEKVAERGDPARTVTVIVDARSKVLDTGVDLVENRSYRVLASGSWGPGPNLKYGPKGSPRKREGDIPLPEARLYCLVGRLGDQGTPFAIGDKMDYKPPKDGRLFLTMNCRPAVKAWGSLVVRISGPRLFIQKDAPATSKLLPVFRQVKVNSRKKEWTSSRLLVKAGDRLLIEGEGEYTLNRAQGLTDIGPEGVSEDSSGLRLGALIGRIGKEHAFFVGRRTLITADSSGQLKFKVHDRNGQYENNEGWMRVKVRALRK